jgi:hypothetical protein
MQPTPAATPDWRVDRFVATTAALAVSLDPVVGTCSAAPFGGHTQPTTTIAADGIELAVEGTMIVGFGVGSRASVETLSDSGSGWTRLLFRAPALVAEPAPIAEVLTLAYATFGEYGTPDAVFSRVAQGLAAAGDLTGAIEAACWSLASGRSTGHLLLGSLLLVAGRPIDAYGHIRTHLALAPDDALGWIALGRACEARGDHPEARRAYARVLRANAATCEAALAREALDRLPARALWDEPWR